MKRGVSFLLSVLVLVALILPGCGQKRDSLQIAGWELYQDTYYGISFKYPQGWPVTQEGGRFSVYSSQDVINRFYDFTAEGPDGVRILVSTQKMDTLETLEEYVAQLSTNLQGFGFDITTTEPSTLVGLPGALVHYKGAVDARNVIEAVQLTAMRDSSLFAVKMEAFNELFAPGRAVFDTVVATLHLPKPRSEMTQEELASPATDFVKFENDRLSVQHPSNFEVSMPKPKAPSEFAMDIKGYRQDSYVHIDVIPAQGLAAEKVVEQNAKFFRETSRGTATVSGTSTTYINYSATKDVQSRVYFLVKNDKFYRVIFNYYAPMRDVYLSAFEKTVGSLAVK
ncbi:MAG: hypothetical protein JW952_00400 [Candidatus Eisenbacteria bacterium]|nr:hypothetical protein [Candidatus Eisenbacteria bacterium]